MSNRMRHGDGGGLSGLFVQTAGIHDRARAFLVGLLLASVAVARTDAVWGSELKPENLRAEYRMNPINLDTRSPRLSWELRSSMPGQAQSAYEIRAAGALDRLSRTPDLWNSGKVASSQSVGVDYAGRPLMSGQTVYWQVRVWDRQDTVSEWSAPARWEMALLAPEEWSARWITRSKQRAVSEDSFFGDDPAPLFRREFILDKARKIIRARIHICGLGYYELRLNGERVGDQVLDPGWTTYSKRVLYSTYDITKQVRSGSNALGVMLGNGWFNPMPLRMWGAINPRDYLAVGEPRVIAQLEIEFADGGRQTVVTDDTWKVAGGPILRNSVFLGETFDARRDPTGWDRPGFNDSKWENAVIATESSLGPLRAQSAPPIRITRALKTVRLSEPKPGVFVFDLGQNFAGWARLRVRGEAGTRIRLRYGELLYPDGTLNGMTAVCGQLKSGGKDYRYDGLGQPKTAFQQDEYVLKGIGTEVYTPRFTFHGFRYVEVTGFPGRPNADAIEGLRLNSDVRPVGLFECSNERLNRIQEMVLWTELSNLFSVQSDCPHREKFGYGGDIVASSEMAMLNFDMSAFYAKAVEDLGDAARPNGGFTETSPYVGISDEGLGDKSGPVGWGTAHPMLLWQLYQYYGNRRLIEQQYPAVKQWIALLQSHAPQYILDNGISDHESLVPKPRALTGTAFYYYNAVILGRLASLLNRVEDATAAKALAAQIRAAFNQRFLQAGTGRYGEATQASQAFALFFGLTPPEEQARALEVLEHDIQEKHNGHLTTGIFGTKYMLHALADAGRAGLAYQIANQPTYPGWGHMLENGATTLWEHWEFSDNTYSHNHPMFGSVSEWFFKNLAGIQPAPDATAFDKIIIRPCVVGDLNWVKAHYDSVRGRVSSHWRKLSNRFELRIEIPVGASATVFVPMRESDRLLVNRRSLAQAAGIKLVKQEANAAILTVPSGSYQFTVYDAR